MRHVKQSRRQLFEHLDRPALKPLPAQRYEYAEWGQVRVNIDYHVCIDDHFYSAPYTLTHETLWYRASHRTVELFHQGKRVASHVRSFKKYGYTTDPSHRPAAHRAHLEWTPSRLIQWGHSVGANTAAVIEYVIRSRPHPEQGYRSALGILRLGEKFTTTRLELACEKALSIHAPGYRSVKTLLEQRMEAAPLRDDEVITGDAEQLGAANVRGRKYYN